VVRRHRDSEHEEIWVGRIAAISIGAIAIGIAMLGGAGLNVSFMVGLAFAVAASANFPALLLALTWRRFNTTGAVTGVLFGVISSIALVIISPTVWAGPDSQGGAFDWYDLANPGIISIPLGFFGCWLGTMLSREEKPALVFDEIWVRSQTGLGAEAGTGLTLTGRRNGTPPATDGAYTGNGARRAEEKALR
jgi:cation/acetate symporter